MPRIQPVIQEQLSPAIQVAWARHSEQYGARITNMKATLSHSLLAFDVYMQWYPLYEQVEKILGKRLAYLYAYSISRGTGCALCSTYFRKIIIEAGENPEKLPLTASQQLVLDFGSSIARHQGHIADHLYNEVAKNYPEQEMVVLVAFAGLMVATTIFNNVIETEIDEYLTEYLPPVKYS